MFLETPVDLIFPAQALFVVPKRNFKKSPDRNKLKRRMKEVYRLRKEILYEVVRGRCAKFLLAFIYIGKDKEEYSKISSSMGKLLDALQKD